MKLSLIFPCFDLFCFKHSFSVPNQVHLDDFHKGEVDKASGESDLWEGMLGNNNGGNEPCMKDPGECP